MPKEDVLNLIKKFPENILTGAGFNIADSGIEYIFSRLKKAELIRSRLAGLPRRSYVSIMDAGSVVLQSVTDIICMDFNELIKDIQDRVGSK